MFDSILAPLSRADFIARHWNKSLLHQAGRPARFSELFSWKDLNTLLELRDLKPPGIGLAQDGKPLDPARYMRGKGAAPAIDPGGLTDALAQGATLIVNAIDEMVPALSMLAAAFEDSLASRVCVNLYAGWGKDNGFGRHWDEQDTMILQVAGRKHWQVHRPTHEHPLRGEFLSVSEPEGVPAWEGTLNDGDLLYLPRGWWHLATPLGEPSLHLTVTIVSPKGTDFIRWLADRMLADPRATRDIPRLGDDAARATFLADLRRALAESAGDEALRQFLERYDAGRQVRPRFALPALPPARQLLGSASLRLAGERRWIFKPSSDGGVTFKSGSRVWRCDTDLVPALQMLSSTVPQPLQALQATVGEGEALARLRRLLTALGVAGAVVVED